MLKGGSVVSDSLETFPQFNASLTREFQTETVKNIDSGDNSSIMHNSLDAKGVQRKYIDLVSEAYVKMNTYNAALVPEDRFHAICMFDGDDGLGGKSHHNATYMRMKKELTNIWFPFKSRYFPSVLPGQNV